MKRNAIRYILYIQFYRVVDITQQHYGIFLPDFGNFTLLLEVLFITISFISLFLVAGINSIIYSDNGY